MKRIEVSLTFGEYQGERKLFSFLSSLSFNASKRARMGHRTMDPLPTAALAIGRWTI